MQPNCIQMIFETKKMSVKPNMWGSGVTLTPTYSGDRPGT